MILHLIIILALTALTQLGGIAWLLALATRFLGRFWIPFFVYYIALSVTAHYTAPLAGREPLPCMDAGPSQIAVLNPLYCALNRHYVVPEMREHADALAAHMHEVYPGTRTRALDAGFPFIDGFPLPPHLSHDDGQKLDLALFFTDKDGEYQLGRASSFIGYWGFVQPPEDDAPLCADESGFSLRWDMDWLQPYLRDWELDTARTGEMMRWLADNPRGEGYRILFEPHLVERLGLDSENIRFQGCKAARHDDHIHLQFVP